jgi:type IV secretion system protein VirD4
MDKDGLAAKLLFWIFGIFFAIFMFASLGSVFFLQLMKMSLDRCMPWTGFLYYLHYGKDANVLKNLGYAHALSGAVVIGFTILFLLPKKLSLFGEARWAKESDLKKASPKLRGTKGIYIGKLRGKYLIQQGQQFVIMAAPTRGMKGVSVVIPNCLTWEGSLICTDIKFENYKITSKCRQQMGNEVFLFSPIPSDYKTHRWNALGYISADKNFRIDDIQNIANYILPTPKGADPMWTSEGRDLFMGIVLFIIDCREFPVTLGEVFRQLRTETETSEYFLAQLEKFDSVLDQNCKMALNKFCNLPDKQREGVKSTVTGALNLWANPLLDAATCENDFDLRDIRKRKMTIYVGITPNNLERLAPVLNLFFQQLVDLNTKHLPNKHTEPEQVLLMLDEFPSLGRMPTIIKGVSFIAGYNLRLLPIIQTPAQLYGLYGKEDADNFIDNHATRLVFAPKKMKEAEEIANELGNMTVKQRSVSSPRDFGKGKGSISTSETKRQLLLPQEVKAIGQFAEIILSENCLPIKAKKITYYNDMFFLSRCVNQKNIKAALASRDQETFLTLVKTPTEVPLVHVKQHEMRGLKEREVEFSEAMQTIDIPTKERLSDSEIDSLAEQFISLLNT